MLRDPWREVSEALSQGFADVEARMDDLSRAGVVVGPAVEELSSRTSPVRIRVISGLEVPSAPRGARLETLLSPCFAGRCPRRYGQILQECLKFWVRKTSNEDHARAETAEGYGVCRRWNTGSLASVQGAWR